MHYNTSNQNNIYGTRQLKDKIIFPATPTLLNKLNITSPKYIEARNIELQNKLDCTQVDNRLRPYQSCAVNFLIKSKNKGLAIFDEQRLGKTPTVLTALKSLKANAIIIVPKSLTYQWYEEYIKWYDDKVTLIEGPEQERIIKYKNAKNSIIISYSLIATDLNYLLKLKHFSHIVIDEAHRIRNIKKSQKYKPEEAKAVITLAQHIEHKIALTGTPSPNNADDIFGILNYLYPDIFSSYYSFCNYYFLSENIWTKNKNGEPSTISKCTGKFKSKEKEQELLEFIETISIQRKRKEVMQWLPKYNITKMLLPMVNEQAKAYETLSKYYEYKDTVCLTTLNILLAQRQLAIAPEILGCNTIGCKLEYVLNYIEDYPEKSIIIVSTLVEPLYKLMNNIKNIKYDLLIGDTPSKKRNEIKKNFQNKKCKLILANLNVIKEGFTLDTADVIIFLDSSYIYTDNIQCMDRLVPTTENNIHSTTQEIILLLAKDTVDEYIYDMVYNKKASSADIINNYKNILERRKNE